MSTEPNATKPDLMTQEGWKVRVDHELKTTSKVYADPTQIATAVLWLRRDPLTQKPFPDGHVTWILGTVFENANDEGKSSKDAFEMIVRSVAVAGLADASAFISETWMSFRSFEKDKPFEPPTVPPRLDPDREEAVAVWTSHRLFGSAMHTAKIETKDGQRILHPFETRSGSQGRFTSFVPPQHLLDNPMIQMAARSYLEHHKHQMELFPQGD